MYLTFAVAFPLYFVNSLRLRLLSLSFFVFLELDVSFVFFYRSFPFLRHCCVFPLSISHSISSNLSDLDSFLPEFICLPVVVSLSYVIAVLLSFVRPLYFVNSFRLCLLYLSFFVFLVLDVSFVFLNRSFPFSVVNSVTYVFACLSYRSSLISLLCQSFFLLLTSLLDICLSRSFLLFLMSLLSYCLSFVHCISSILPDFVCFPCRSLYFSC